MTKVKNSFFFRVYQVVSRIPEGKVATYGQIAQKLGTRDARRVGHALHANSNVNTPCHRVVSKSGRLSPSFSFDGEVEQRKRLEKEGIGFTDEGNVDLERYLWQPRK